MAPKDLWSRLRGHAQRVCLDLSDTSFGLTDPIRANLNKSYFSNRQDRYIHFNHSTLAAYCYDFLQTSSAFAFRLLPSASRPAGYTVEWEQSDTHPHHIEALAEEMLSNFQKRWQTQSMKALGDREDPSGHALVVPVIQSGQFRVREEEHSLSNLFQALPSETERSRRPARFNGPLIELSSGYFGLNSDHCERILQSHASFRIIAASPRVCFPLYCTPTV